MEEFVIFCWVLVIATCILIKKRIEIFCWVLALVIATYILIKKRIEK